MLNSMHVRDAGAGQTRQRNKRREHYGGKQPLISAQLCAQQADMVQALDGRCGPHADKLGTSWENAISPYQDRFLILPARRRAFPPCGEGQV